MNGFLDRKFPKFDHKHGFLSSLKADIISFLLSKAPIFIFDILGPSYIFLGGSPSKLDRQTLEAWLKKRGCFIFPVTMSNTIVFYTHPISTIFQQSGSHIDFFTPMGSDFHILIPLPDPSSIPYGPQFGPTGAQLGPNWGPFGNVA